MTLYDERAQLVAEMRAIVNKADSENRDFTAEETGQVDRIEQAINAKTEEIETAEKEANEARRERLSQYEQFSRQPPVKVQQHDREEPRAEIDKMEALRSYFRTGGKGCSLQERAALQMDSDTAGGSLVMPEQFVNQLIQGLDESLAIMQNATVIDVPNAGSLGAPALGNDPADDTWTVEIATGAEDSTFTFGKRILNPHPVAKLLKVSKTLIRRSSLPVDMIVRDRLNKVLGHTLEKGFMTGSGANQPLGLFTASGDGIDTGRDYSTGNTTTEIAADGLIGAKYNLIEPYLRSANLRWIFHRDAVSQIRKLKGGDGQYLWQEGLAADRPPQLLGVPVIMSEYAPNTFTTGLYVGLIGDLSYYWIARSLAMTIEVASELYMATNQDGYFTRAEMDGMPVLAEAFSRVTLA